MRQPCHAAPTATAPGDLDLDLDLAADGVVATAEQLGRLLIDPEAYTPDRVMRFVRQALRLLTA